MSVKFPASRIEKAAAQNDERPALHGVYFDADRNQLVAANGFCMAVVPVEVDEDSTDVSAVVSMSLIRQARKKYRKRSFRVDIDGIGESGAEVKLEGVSCPAGTKFPDYTEVVPDEKETTMAVTLDAGYLKDLAEAVSGAIDGRARFGVTLYIKDEKSAILVKPISSGGVDSFGVLMPMQPPERCVDAKK